MVHNHTYISLDNNDIDEPVCHDVEPTPRYVREEPDHKRRGCTNSKRAEFPLQVIETDCTMQSHRLSASTSLMHARHRPLCALPVNVAPPSTTRVSYVSKEARMALFGKAKEQV